MRMRPDGSRGGSPAHLDVLGGPHSGIAIDGEGGGGTGSKWPLLLKSDVVLVGELGVVLVGWYGSSKLGTFNYLCIPDGPSSITARSLDVLSSTNRTSRDAINECVSMSSNL
jgi:hypothetical protein